MADSRPVNDPNNEVRMLLIGKTGVGKSTTGNLILGARAFDSLLSAQSVTMQTKYSEADRFGKRLVVVDTPGLFDTKRTYKEIQVEMSKWYSLVSPGIHAILLLTPIGRFTAEEQKTVEFFMKVFGKNLKDFLIIVFTQKDRLEESNMTLNDYIKTMDTSSNLRILIDQCNWRCVALGHKGKEEDRIAEVQEILAMIQKIKGKDGNNYYTNEVFKKVEKALQEDERKSEMLRLEKKEDKNEKEECVTPRVRDRSQIRSEIVNNTYKADDAFTKIVVTVGDALVAAGGMIAESVGAVASLVGGWFGF